MVMVKTDPVINSDKDVQRGAVEKIFSNAPHQAIILLSAEEHKRSAALRYPSTTLRIEGDPLQFSFDSHKFEAAIDMKIKDSNKHKFAWVDDKGNLQECNELPDFTLFTKASLPVTINNKHLHLTGQQFYDLKDNKLVVAVNGYTKYIPGNASIENHSFIHV